MPEHEMEKYYRHRAPSYEEIYHRDDQARQAELKDEAERLAEFARGKDVLEYACGSGYWTEIMATVARSITAVDLEPAMLEVARAKKYPIEVSFHESDMFAYDPEGNTFDLVALGFWFSHQPRQEFDRLFDLLTGNLRPDGLVWMIDNNPPAEGPTNESVGRDEHGNNFKRRYLSDGREFVILKNYFERVELTEIFGPRFEILRLEYGYRYWSVQLKPR